MMGRVARAWGRRVAAGDTYDLAELVEFRRTLDGVITQAVVAARATQPEAWSWSGIGDALGISRQAAQQRYGQGS